MTIDWHVREAAALSLGILDDPRALKPLLNMLDDEKDSVRYGAVLALSSVGDDSALKQLENATKDESLMVRQIAEFAIAEIEKKYGASI